MQPLAIEETLDPGDAPAAFQGGLAHRLRFEPKPWPMWVYDAQTLHFLAVNEAAVASHGDSEAEFFRMSLPDIRPEDEQAQLEACLAAPESQRNSGLNRRRRGELIRVHIVAAPNTACASASARTATSSRPPPKVSGPSTRRPAPASPTRRWRQCRASASRKWPAAGSPTSWTRRVSRSRTRPSGAAGKAWPSSMTLSFGARTEATFGPRWPLTLPSASELGVRALVRNENSVERLGTTVRRLLVERVRQRSGSGRTRDCRPGKDNASLPSG